MSDGAVEIRLYDPKDLPALHEIRRAAFAPIFAGFREALGLGLAEKALGDPEGEQAALLDSLCQPSEDRRIFVAVEDDRPIGFVAALLDADRKIGEIGLNAVSPDHAGRGVGSALYARALEAMREAGMRAATVNTGGDDAHAPARRAYEKAGFDAGIPSLWMARAL